jgi:hypothetical protein
MIPNNPDYLVLWLLITISETVTHHQHLNGIPHLHDSLYELYQNANKLDVLQIVAVNM